jgi:long-subunit acyl-CoA synthetase (AMP-forming)
VDAIIVDEEFRHLLDHFHKEHPSIPFIIDTDTDATEGELSGPFDEAVLEGLQHDTKTGSKGWAGLKAQCDDENGTIAIPFTSGTTAKPKGVVYSHRGAYLAALGNVIESGLNYNIGRCRYLWTLPMFHAVGVSLSLPFISGQLVYPFPFSRS